MTRPVRSGSAGRPLPRPGRVGAAPGARGVSQSIRRLKVRSPSSAWRTTMVVGVMINWAGRCGDFDIDATVLPGDARRHTVGRKGSSRAPSQGIIRTTYGSGQCTVAHRARRRR